MPAPRKMIPKIRYIAQRVFWFDASQEDLEKEKKIKILRLSVSIGTCKSIILILNQIICTAD